MTRLITADTHTFEDDDKVDGLGLDWEGGNPQREAWPWEANGGQGAGEEEQVMEAGLQVKGQFGEPCGGHVCLGCCEEEEGLPSGPPHYPRSVTDVAILRFFWNKSSGVDVTGTELKMQIHGKVSIETEEKHWQKKRGEGGCPGNTDTVGRVEVEQTPKVPTGRGQRNT